MAAAVVMSSVSVFTRGGYNGRGGAQAHAHGRGRGRGGAQSTANSQEQPAEQAEDRFCKIPSFLAAQACLQTDQIPFLRAVGQATGTFVVRANEKYRNFQALWFGERAYVRSAIRRSERFYIYFQPGNKPLIIMINCCDLHTTPVTTDVRMFEAVQMKMHCYAAPPRPESLTFTLPPTSPLFRVVGRNGDFQALIDAGIKFTSLVQDFVPGLTRATAPLEAQHAALVGSMNTMELKHILDAPDPEHYFTIRFAQLTSHEEGVARATQIAKTLNGSCLYKGFNTIRGFSPFKISPEILKSMGLSRENELIILDVALPNVVIDRPPPRGWNAVPDLPPATERTVRCRLSANFPCQEVEVNALAKHFKFRITATVDQLTDCVNAFLVEFAAGEAEAVEKLLNSTIDCGQGRCFYFSDARHQV
jgi:hypothetical protein